MARSGVRVEVNLPPGGLEEEKKRRRNKERKKGRFEDLKRKECCTCPGLVGGRTSICSHSYDVNAPPRQMIKGVRNIPRNKGGIVFVAGTKVSRRR